MSLHFETCALMGVVQANNASAMVTKYRRTAMLSVKGVNEGSTSYGELWADIYIGITNAAAREQGLSIEQIVRMSCVCSGCPYGSFVGIAGDCLNF